MLETEWILEASNERGGVELIGMATEGDVATEERKERNDDKRVESAAMAMGEEAATDEWKEERNDDRIADDSAVESSGVDSDAGGFGMAVLASRLQTGQNVLQEVSQASTQNAWNL